MAAGEAGPPGPPPLPWVLAAGGVSISVAVLLVNRFRVFRRGGSLCPRVSRRCRGDSGSSSSALLSSFLPLSKTSADVLSTRERHRDGDSLYSQLFRRALVVLAPAVYITAALALVFLLLMALHNLRQLVAWLAVAASTSTAFPLPWSSHPSDATCKATAQWPGWAGVKYAFIFGDSYTQTGFNYSIKPAPSSSNPMGNPAYPGWTSSNGPNWVGYLTTKYNASRLQTYNLASGGATVDAALVAPYAPTVLSVKDQVRGEFLPGYTTSGAGGAGPSAPGAPPWRGSDSLFAVWIGINDVGNSYYRGGANETAALNARIFAVYAGLVDQLYAAGARNFAFLTVPPVDRSPLATGSGDAAAQALEKADIAAFNGLLTDGLAAALQAKHADSANVWVVDTGAPFNAVLDNPAAYPQTAGLKNTTGFCEAYSNGTPARDTLKPGCGVPVNEYFWLNSLHPTYPIHDVVAEQVAKALAAGPNICGSSSK